MDCNDLIFLLFGGFHTRAWSRTSLCSQQRQLVQTAQREHIILSKVLIEVTLCYQIIMKFPLQKEWGGTKHNQYLISSSRFSSLKKNLWKFENKTSKNLKFTHFILICYTTKSVVTNKKWFSKCRTNSVTWWELYWRKCCVKTQKSHDLQSQHHVISVGV